MLRGLAVVRGLDIRILAASVVTGVAVALIVAFFDALTVELLFDWLSEQRIGVQMAAPAAGILIAIVVLRYLGHGADSATSDEYVRAFHERHPRIPLRELPAKLLAGLSTIGMGGAVGHPWKTIASAPSTFSFNRSAKKAHPARCSWDPPP